MEGAAKEQGKDWQVNNLQRSRDQGKATQQVSATASTLQQIQPLPPTVSIRAGDSFQAGPRMPKLFEPAPLNNNNDINNNGCLERQTRTGRYRLHIL